MGVRSGKCKSKARLDGRTAIVTGCNTGIGKETVLDFYKRGCRVIMACRNITKANAAKEDIINQCGNSAENGHLVVRILDLSSFSSIRKCAAEILEEEPQINVLVNNAAVRMCPKSFTEDGFELQFGTNHLGHFLFTMLLLPRMLNSPPARVINVSSLAHRWGKIVFDDFGCEKSYSPLKAHSTSKLANILFSKELSRRLEGSDVKCYSLHPGTVETETPHHLDGKIFSSVTWLWRHIGKLGIKTAKQGAQTTIYCAVDEKAGEETGKYYSDCKTKRPSRRARNMKTAKRLWEESLNLVGMAGYDPLTADDRRESERRFEEAVRMIDVAIENESDDESYIEEKGGEFE